MKSIFVGGALVAALLTATDAGATAFCNIRSTSDGFVALRAGPSGTARLVARMRVGDEIQAHSDRRGMWIKATWWKGGRFKQPRDAGYDPPNGSGWVHGSLIEDDCG
ncbi:MAG: SH3 domain-containing protein [Beijerinckiaceae bacterium]